MSQLAKIRGAKIRVGDIVTVRHTRFVVAALRRAMHRPDVSRVLTDESGKEHMIDTRCLYTVGK